jgi:hypothetical protein
MKRTWTSEELLEHFTLLPDELAAVSNKSGATRLGFAVLLKETIQKWVQVTLLSPVH